MAFLVGLGELIAQSLPQADGAWLPGVTRANGFVSGRTEPNVSDGVIRACELIRTTSESVWVPADQKVRRSGPGSALRAISHGEQGAAAVTRGLPLVSHTSSRKASLLTDRQT